jgi:hypothetical protein
MAKLKKAPGRVIGRWKAEAIAANTGASDEDLARIINEMARKQGYDYTITPEKVRAKSKKSRRRKRSKATPAAASTARTTPASAARADSRGGFSMEDIRVVKGLVKRIGTEKLRELAGVLSS